jgi:putative hydroxymethylpyrimidine transport system permease protein
MNFLRPLLVFAGLLVLWQAIVSLSGVAPFILPAPLDVLTTAIERADVLAGHARITILEIILGLIFGTVFGTVSALTMSYFRPARAWILPVLVVSQAIPVFALAPVLVLWLGYGMVPKVVMATLIIYFPVTAAFYDGLRRTETGWLDLAQTMGASKWAILRQIRLPAAMPAFASGLRVAAAVAPIGAVVGEWVGSSAGLGYYMLLMNGRVQTDAMFAALFVLALVATAIYFTIDALLRRAISWQSESDPAQIT